MYVLSFRGIGRAIRRKTATAECLRLDARELAAAGLFKHPAPLFVKSRLPDRELLLIDECELLEYDPEGEIQGVLTMRYAHENDEVMIDIPLDWTEQKLGGVRVFFLCPECDETRCDILYRPPWERYYACRTCHRLTYYSSQDSRKHPFTAWTITCRRAFYEPPLLKAKQSQSVLKALQREARRLKYPVL